MISEILQKARQYEQKYGAFISNDERPVYHLSTKIGWMNDPNGLCFFGGKYCGFIVGRCFSFFKRNGVHWTGWQAITETVTVVFSQQFCFTVYDTDSSFVTGVSTKATAVT